MTERYLKKRYFLAEYHHPETLKRGVYPVTSMGWTKDGHRIERWAMVFADSMREARERFASGDAVWIS